MDYGSTYNPTGDPLFHMPYQLRIDAIINGNSERLNNREFRWSGKACGFFVEGESKPVKTFVSVSDCANYLKIDRTTLRMRISRKTLLDGNKFIAYLED